jgi:hypothetical protein
LHARSALIGSLDSVAPHWGIALIQETDAVAKHLESDNSMHDEEGAKYMYQYARHWPGEASLVQIVLVHKRLQSYVR